MSQDGDTHESFRRAEPVKTSSDRSFGIVFTVVFLLVARVFGRHLKYGGVLDRRSDDLWAVTTAECLIIRFCRAAGEDYILSRRTNESRDLLSCFFHAFARRTALSVNRRRIAVIAKCRGNCFPHLRR